MWNALLYTVALHARPSKISIHDVRADSASYRIMFSCGPSARDVFLDAVARDFGGFLRAYTEDGSLGVARTPPTPLDDVQSQLDALVS